MISLLKDHYFHTDYVEENNFEPFFNSQPGYIPPFPELTEKILCVSLHSTYTTGRWNSQSVSESVSQSVDLTSHEKYLSILFNDINVIHDVVNKNDDNDRYHDDDDDDDDDDDYEKHIIYKLMLSIIKHFDVETTAVAGLHRIALHRQHYEQ
uniref:Uncharacterized protein n=1 Tax=Glossina austeni TaxID=7395 RepID=A0A1A9VCW3_GLOAU